MNYKEVKPQLKQLMDQYGVYFNMATTLLMEKGWENIGALDVDKIKNELEKEEAEIRARGAYPAVSADAWVEMYKLAQDIAKITSPVNLLIFSKDCMPWDTGRMELKRVLDIAYVAIDMAYNENMYSYEDEEEWEEHVMLELDLDEDEWDEICNH